MYGAIALVVAVVGLILYLWHVSGTGGPVIHAKMLRLELLNVKADLERELEDFVLNCSACGLDVHWVSGMGVQPGRWGHREPAPHGEPVVT
jgi:hypothetical protein